MKQTIIECLLLFLMFGGLRCQNLIPNGDFNNPINDPSQTEHWLNTPEWDGIKYYTINNENVLIPQRESDLNKYEDKRFASAPVKVTVVHASLQEPLEKGKTYCFSMDYTTFSDISNTYQIKAYFKKSIDIRNRELYTSNDNSKYFPLKFNKIPNNQNSKWQTICANYKAVGGEKYITFSFSSFKNTILYFDNISLTKNDYKKNICCLCNNTINKMDTLVLENLHFNTNSSIIELNSYPELDKLVDFLKANASLKLAISGHTDNTGNSDKNKALSEQRAKAVYDYLIKNGISKDRLKFMGYGDTKPLLPNTSEQNKTKNRRVEIVFE